MSFIPIGIIGMLLLYSYYYYATQNKANVSNLWGGIKNPTIRKFYYASMIVAALCFLIMLWYLFKTHSLTKQQTYEIMASLFAIVFVSLFWMPLSLHYIKKKSPLLKWTIIAVLLLIALSALNAVRILKNINETHHKVSKKIALYSMVHFFIHTFFLDTLVWSFNFF